MSLFNSILTADAIEIDNQFIRHFYVEQEDLEVPESVALNLSFFSSDGDLYEYFFTVRELDNAIYDSEEKCWNVTSAGETYQLTLFNLTIIEQSS